MRFNTSLHSLMLALVGAGLCTSVQAVVTVEPATAPVGKTNELTLRFDHPETIDSVSLQPGSPYLVERLDLNSEHPTYQIIRRHNGIYLRDRDNNVIAVFANKRGSVSSKHYDFIAAAEAGLQVYKEHDWRHKTPVASYRSSTPSHDVAVSDGLAFVANGNGGLTVLDIENPEQPLWLGSHQKLGYTVKVSSEARRVAVLNDAGMIFLIDATNPLEPTTLSSYRSDDTLLDIALHGNLLFVLTPDEIQVMDFSATSPQLSNEGLDFGQGVNLGGERRVYIDNNLAYVADWFSGIHIYDLSRPRQPELLSSYHTPGSPKGIVVRDGVAFVADDDHGLQVLDVSNPLEPTLVSTLLTQGLAYTPRLVGDLLYLASHRGGFQIIDISDVSSPRLVSEYDTDGKAWSMEIHNNIAYVADDDSGLLMFDVSDPTRPELIGQHFNGGAAEEVVVRDNIAYVAFFDDGLQILDVSDPRQPQLITHLALPGNARGLDLVGDKLYVAGWLAGVHIVDVSNIKQPQLLGSHDTRGATWGLKVVDTHLYAMDWWGGVSVIDISEPNRPRAVGGYHNRGQVHDISALDNYSFVAHGSNGLQVFDIKNPLNPTWTTGVNFPGQARQIALQGQHAYVAAGDGGLAIIDISNPFSPQWLGSIDTRGEVMAVNTDAKHTYLLDSREGLIALDISHEPPRKQARLNIKANDLWLYDEQLYLATDNGVEVVRLNKDTQFEFLTRFDIANGAQRISGNNRLVFVSSGKSLLSLKRGLQMEKLGHINVEGQISDIEPHVEGLLISTSNALYNIDNRHADKLEINTHYPLLANSSNITYHQGVIYISGEETITALQPMPVLKQQIQGMDEITFNLPASLGIGSYNLKVSYNDGTDELIRNAIQIEMPKFSKPKMSMEQFKKLMQQQQGNSNLFTKPVTPEP